MSQVFDLCESTFKTSIRQVQQRLSRKSATKDRQFCQGIKAALNDSEEEIRKMSIQYSSTKNREMKNRIDIYKRQLTNYKKEYEQVLEAVEQQQQANQLFRQADKQSKGYNQNDKLIQGKRMMYENLDVNDQISNNLKHQTDILSGARGKMDKINSQLTVAHKLLNSIKAKLEKNKKVMWLVMALFVCVIGFVIYSYL